MNSTTATFACEFASRYESLCAKRAKQRCDMCMHAKWCTNNVVEWSLVEPHHERHRLIEQRVEASDAIDE